MWREYSLILSGAAAAYSVEGLWAAWPRRARDRCRDRGLRILPLEGLRAALTFLFLGERLLLWSIHWFSMFLFRPHVILPLPLSQHLRQWLGKDWSSLILACTSLRLGFISTADHAYTRFCLSWTLPVLLTILPEFPDSSASLRPQHTILMQMLISTELPPVNLLVMCIARLHALHQTRVR